MKKYCFMAIILLIAISGFGFNGEQILQMNERYSAEYFWNEANPFNGLIRDRTTPDSPCSVAAVGFGLVSNCISAENGWIPKKLVYERTLTTLKIFKNLENLDGFYYHFIDMWTGKRAMQSEISSIDTALFIAGALFAGQYFQGTEVETLAKELYDRINWDSMRNGSPFISMGYNPEKGYLPYYWDTYSECMILYILSIGSDTHPIPAEIWNKWYRNKKGKDETEHISSGPESLFTYQYSHGFIDFRYIEDEFANYFENSKKAILYNIDFAKKESYKTFTEGFWGISAGDGPSGYKNHGARLFGTDGTVVPYAVVASTPFLPETSLKGLTKLWDIKNNIWGRYGFKSAFNLDSDWYSSEFIGIDKGIEVIMSENYRNEFVWNYFMELGCVKKAIERIGFKQLERPEENVKKANPDKLPVGAAPDSLIADNFERGFAKFGAGAWHGGSSAIEDAVAEISDEQAHEGGNYSLGMFYCVEPDGKFNGAWIKLGGLDAGKYGYMVFWLKGDETEGYTEEFKIEIKSPGGIGVYVVKGVTSEWQKYVIPFTEIENHDKVKWNDLQEIAVVFEDWRATDKTGKIYLDDIYFTNHPEFVNAEDFEKGMASFGAGAWHGGSSTVDDCVVEITDELLTETNEYCMKAFYCVEPEGKFNGAWLKLGDLNAENCEYFTFSIKGDVEEGFTETFKIEVKEPGTVGVYVVEGVTSEWQEISIPLSEFNNSENMKWKNLSEIAIVFEDWRATDKTGTLYFDNFYFN